MEDFVSSQRPRQRLVRTTRRTLSAALLTLVSACSSLGLGNVLGSVLGGQQNGGQLAGVVEGVDPRSQQIAVQQSNGQTVWVSYDNNTQVVYQNRNYPPTALERGDQIAANVQSNGNGQYYTNYVQVTQSVQNSGGVYGSGNGSGSSGGVLQAYRATVQRINYQGGWFSADVDGVGLTNVALGNTVTQNDINRFNSLRGGETVRFYGNRQRNGEIVLRQFY